MRGPSWNERKLANMAEIIPDGEYLGQDLIRLTYIKLARRLTRAETTRLRKKGIGVSDSYTTDECAENQTWVYELYMAAHPRRGEPA